MGELIILVNRRWMELRVPTHLGGFVPLLDELLQGEGHGAGQRLQLLRAELRILVHPGQVQDILLVVSHLAVARRHSKCEKPALAFLVSSPLSSRGLH